jgi:hypothetical protein
MSIDGPIGGGRRFAVNMDGKLFAAFNTLKQAQSYVVMQKSKVKGNSRDKAYAADREWSIIDRGGE